MEKSKVYFANFRATVQENIQQKLVRLMKTAGMDTIDFDKKYVAIKIHFGEPGNLAYLRPNYAKTVVDFVKSLGGKPFLTDCNTLYVGGRKNALDHLDSAYVNGFSPFSTGCHVIIADGLKGTDEVLVPVEGGTYVKEAKIGRAVMDAVKSADDESNDILNCKMAEYTKAVIDGRPNFHISLVMDVSPYCDCHGENDAPIVPDVGMFASFDPVALDKACADAVNRQPICRGSVLDEVEHVHHDHFTDIFPDTNWSSCLEHAKKLGLGTDDYELIQI